MTIIESMDAATIAAAVTAVARALADGGLDISRATERARNIVCVASLRDESIDVRDVIEEMTSNPHAVGEWVATAETIDRALDAWFSVAGRTPSHQNNERVVD